MNRLFWKYLFFLVFSVICFENFCFLEIIKPLYHRWKYKAPVFSHPSLQLQFSRYSNLPVLALTHLVFHRGLDYKSKIKSWEEKVRNNQELSGKKKKVGLVVINY
jgi:hypothetical protein